MPRITKAEVRASMMNEPKKVVSDKKEKLFREKIKEEQPYPSVTERTEVPRRSEEKLQSANSEDKTDTKVASVGNKGEGSIPSKKVNISNFDPTPIRQQRKFLAIDEKEINEARQEILDSRDKIAALEKEKESLEEALAIAENSKLESETLKESYENKLAQTSADYNKKLDSYNKNLIERNEEISDLKAQLLFKTREVEKLLAEKNSKKTSKMIDKLSTIAAYIVFGILSIGIIGLIGLLVAKGLFTLGGWLF